jgi:hypothetical protein
MVDQDLVLAEPGGNATYIYICIYVANTLPPHTKENVATEAGRSLYTYVRQAACNKLAFMRRASREIAVGVGTGYRL